MANYTEKDLNDILVEYIADRSKQVEVLKARTIVAKSPIELTLIAGETATMFHRMVVASSIIVDLSADEFAASLASGLLDDPNKRMPNC